MFLTRWRGVSTLWTEVVREARVARVVARVEREGREVRAMTRVTTWTQTPSPMARVQAAGGLRLFLRDLQRVKARLARLEEALMALRDSIDMQE